MTDRRVAVDGIALQVRDEEGGGYPLVLLHFSGANLVMWERALPCFRGRFRVIRLDLRGHGRSDAPDTGYHMDDMARDVAGVLAALGIRRTHLVGSSMGAEVALAMAANCPAAVATLVLDGARYDESGPHGAWEGTDEAFRDHVAKQLAALRSAPEPEFPSLDALVEDSRRALEPLGWWNADVEAMERYGARRAGDGTWRKGFPRPARRDYFAHYFAYRLEASYRRVACPLLMLAEPGDAANPRTGAAMRALCALASHARIEAVDGWRSPFGWLLDPRDACGRVLTFLEDHGATP